MRDGRLLRVHMCHIAETDNAMGWWEIEALISLCWGVSSDGVLLLLGWSRLKESLSGSA